MLNFSLPYDHLDEEAFRHILAFSVYALPDSPLQSVRRHVKYEVVQC